MFFDRSIDSKQNVEEYYTSKEFVAFDGKSC